MTYEQIHDKWKEEEKVEIVMEVCKECGQRMNCHDINCKTAFKQISEMWANGFSLKR